MKPSLDDPKGSQNDGHAVLLYLFHIESHFSHPSLSRTMQNLISMIVGKNSLLKARKDIKIL
jgi:hypothetical protein